MVADGADELDVVEDGADEDALEAALSLPPDAAASTTIPPSAVEVTDGLAAVYVYTGASEKVAGADEIATDEVETPL